MTEFIALIAKTYAFIQINEEDKLEEHKKAKGTKKCVIKNISILTCTKELYLVMKQ